MIIPPFIIKEIEPSTGDAIFPGGPSTFPSIYINGKLYNDVPTLSDSTETRIQKINAIRNVVIGANPAALARLIFSGSTDGSYTRKNGKEADPGSLVSEIRSVTRYEIYSRALKAIKNSLTSAQRDLFLERSVPGGMFGNVPEALLILADFVAARYMMIQASRDRRLPQFCAFLTPMILKRETGQSARIETIGSGGTKVMVFERRQGLYDPDSSEEYSVISRGVRVAPALGAFQTHPSVLATVFQENFAQQGMVKRFVREYGAFLGCTNFGLQYLVTAARNTRMGRQRQYWDPRDFSAYEKIERFTGVMTRNIQQAKYMFGYPNLLSQPLGTQPSNWRSSILDRILDGLRFMSHTSIRPIDFLRGLPSADYDGVQLACQRDVNLGSLGRSILSYAKVSNSALRMAPDTPSSPAQVYADVFKDTNAENNIALNLCVSLSTLSMMTPTPTRTIALAQGSDVGSGMFVSVRKPLPPRKNFN